MAYSYEAFFCARYAACYENVWSFKCTVADVAAFDGDFFAVFSDFEYAFVVFGSLVVAHLPCAWYAVPDVTGVPRSECGDTAFGFSPFVL